MTNNDTCSTSAQHEFVVVSDHSFKTILADFRVSFLFPSCMSFELRDELSLLQLSAWEQTGSVFRVSAGVVDDRQHWLKDRPLITKANSTTLPFFCPWQRWARVGFSGLFHLCDVPVPWLELLHSLQHSFYHILIQWCSILPPRSEWKYMEMLLFPHRKKELQAWDLKLNPLCLC